VTATLSITILANATAAKKAFAETSEGAEDLGTKSAGMGKAIAAGAAAGVAGLVALGVQAFNAAEESARIGRETERVIRTTGAAAWISASQVGELSTAISDKTGADDEAIQSGANLLLTFTNIQNAVGEGNDIFDQATQAALDMSTALGTDMSAASIQLGKALNDPIKGMTALSKSGVSFTEQQRDQIKTLVESGDVLGAQKVILAEVQREFAGAAEAAGTPLDKLKVKFGNLQEDIGAKLIPVVSAAATIIGDNMGPAIDKATAFLAEHSEAVKFLASVGLAGLAVAYGPIVAGQAAMIASNVVGYVTGVTQAAVYMGQAFLTVAGQQGVLAASTQALNYALAAMGPALLALAIGGAIYGLISVFDRSSEAADEFFESVTQDVDTSSFDEMRGAVIAMDAELLSLKASIQGSGWGDVAASIADVLIPFRDVENSLLDQQDKFATLEARQQAYAATLVEVGYELRSYAEASVLAAHGIADQADASFAMTEATRGINNEIDATNVKLREIAETEKIDLTEPGAADRVQALYEKTQFVTEGTLGMSEAQEKYSEATATAKDKTDAFKSSLDSLIGIHLSYAQAETQYSENSLSLLKTLTEGRNAAAGATKAGTDASIAQIAAINDNNAAIQANAKSALDLASATYQETGSLDAASASLATNRQHLIDTMIATGYSKDAAVAYVDQLGLTPDNINTAVNLDNAAANQGIAGTQGQLNQINAGANAVITADTSPAQRALDEFWKRMPNFSGPITPEMALKWLEAHPRAAGGPVARGSAYIVGERGPELFTPGISGRIIPTGASRAALAGEAGGGGTTTINVSVASTGLGPDSPRLQADLIEALRRWTARNGSLPGTTTPGGHGATGPAGPAGPAGEQGPAGPKGDPGDTGATGATGTQGPKGDPGVDGLSVLNGAGPPAAGLGRNGEFYIDTTASRIYGPKTAGAWGAGVPLIGPQGPVGATGSQGTQGPAGTAGAQGPKGDTGATGSTGAAGVDGLSVLNGAGPPAAGLGRNGEFYIDTTASRIYGPKTAGAWGAGMPLIGPQGPVGATGSQGPAGTAGTQGPPGPGVPTGGTTGQLATKNSATNYDVRWSTPAFKWG
jgi:hypothetical protein